MLVSEHIIGSLGNPGPNEGANGENTARNEDKPRNADENKDGE
jgi:hypothetical protein